MKDIILKTVSGVIIGLAVSYISTIIMRSNFGRRYFSTENHPDEANNLNLEKKLD